jgi:hypothetical protein
MECPAKCTHKLPCEGLAALLAQSELPTPCPLSATLPRAIPFGTVFVCVSSQVVLSWVAHLHRWWRRPSLGLVKAVVLVLAWEILLLLKMLLLRLLLLLLWVS